MTVMIQGLRADQIRQKPENSFQSWVQERVRIGIERGWLSMPEHPETLARERSHASKEREKKRRRIWMRGWRFRQRLARRGFDACGQLFFPWGIPEPSDCQKPSVRQRRAKAKPFCRFRQARFNPAQLTMAFCEQTEAGR